jgi:hypothetical protein
MEELAHDLGLELGPCEVTVKVVNSKSKEVVGVASAVHIQLDKWKGHADFIVLWMDDFEVILGQEFLRRTWSVLMPFAEEVGYTW